MQKHPQVLQRHPFVFVATLLHNLRGKSLKAQGRENACAKCFYRLCVRADMRLCECKHSVQLAFNCHLFMLVDNERGVFPVIK